MRWATAAGLGVVLLACQAKGGERRREFDGQRAFTYVTDQMKFGPRVPGTPLKDADDVKRFKRELGSGGLKRFVPAEG